MRNQPMVVAAILLLTAVAWAEGAGAQAPAQEQPALANYGRLPLHFEANQGQTAEQVKFLARGSGYELFLTQTESVLVLRRPDAAGSVVRMKLLGANPRPAVKGREELPGRSHYFIGSDRKRWRTNVPQYARVEYREVYPGVSLTYYGNQGQLEYDFVVRPGADPGLIRLGIEGADEIRLDAEGNLHMSLTGGVVIERAPIVYQQVGGARRVIPGRFVLHGRDEVGFDVGSYDAGRPLVLDPVLIYSTYLGGGDLDIGDAIAVDAVGNAYVAGLTTSTDFPTANALQAENRGDYDAFVAKLNAAGSALVYSTYLGGSGFDIADGVVVDGAGNAYVTGSTQSTDFPTANALQAVGDGGEAFVAKLNAAGSELVYSTYLGGNGFESASGIGVDGWGNSFVTGATNSTDFPTANARQPENGGGVDAFIANLNAAGSALVYSTYLGGSGDDFGGGIAVDAAGTAYVTGRTYSVDFPTANALQAENAGADDAFVAKLTAAGSAIYSTYLGGTGSDSAFAVAADPRGNAYVTGRTESTDFPTFKAFQAANRGGFDAFVTKLNDTGLAFLYSSYLGGSSVDSAFGVAVDGSQNVYITGYTLSTNFPTRNPFQAANAGLADVFATKLTRSVVGRTGLDYSTYLGGSGNDQVHGIAVDARGNAYVTGDTDSIDFPTVKPFQAALSGYRDVFVSKIGTPRSTSPPE